MKTKRHFFLSFPTLALAAVISLSASASAVSNSWNTTTGDWDTSTLNWSSPTTWTNGNDAFFSNTATASIITLSSGLTAGSVIVGNLTNNANYTFSGGSLSATTFTAQANAGNDLGTPTPITTLNNTSLSLTGDLGVGRATLVISGNSTVTADRIGGAGMTGISSADWGQVTIQDTANVTATNGIVGDTTAWGLNLNGGTLTTKSINCGPHSYNGTTNLNFNGTLVKANQDNANFITVSGGVDFNPEIKTGGAKIDTNGFTIGIGVVLTGTGALTKSGSGTLNLNLPNSYSGGTTVDGGTLSLNHEPIGIADTSIGAMTSSNTVTINNGGTLTGTTNNWLSNTALASGGSNAISVVVNAGGTLKGCSGGITGLGNVTLNGAAIEVTNGLGNYGWDASFTLGGDITVGGSVASSITTSAGAGGTANIYMADGSNGTGGTRFLTVEDVTSSAASDLLISARLSNGTLVKKGPGTVEIVAGETGIGSPITWEIEEGSFLLAEPATFEFRVTNTTSNRVVEASGGTGSAAFNGTLNINTSAVTLTTSNTWSLIDVTSLGATFGTNFAVAGFGGPDVNGIWTKTDVIGDWSFSKATGELTLVAGSDYDTWKTDNSVTGTETDDDDSDGLTNFEEYAFGLIPNSGSSVNPIVTQLNKATGQFSYTRRLQSKTGLNYTVRSSTTLETNGWTDLVKDTDYTEAVSAAGDLETVTITLTPAPTAARLFVHVRAQ